MATITIPDDICARAQALGLDVEKFVIESLRSVVAKMETHLKDAVSNTTPEAAPRGRGRLPKAAGRVPVTLYIERPLYNRLAAMAKRTGISKGDALNQVLEKAAAAGILPPEE